MPQVQRHEIVFLYQMRSGLDQAVWLAPNQTTPSTSCVGFLKPNNFRYKHDKEKRSKSSIYSVKFLSKNATVLEFPKESRSVLDLIYKNIHSGDPADLYNSVKNCKSVREINDLFPVNKTVYILYPHKNARNVSSLSKAELESIGSVIAIDSTWRQTNVSV